jgi:hypothetical protein
VIGHPALLILKAAVAGFIGAGLLLGVVGLCLDRRLEPWEAVALGGLVLAGMAIAITSTSPVTFLGVIFLLVAVPLAVQAFSRLTERQVTERLLRVDETRARALIEADPRNAAAHSLLGDIYRRRGQMEEAVEQYEEAVRLMPDSQQERWKLGRASKELSLQERGARLCPMCGGEIDRGQRRCPHCDYTLSVAEGLREWTQTRGLQRTITTTLLIMVALTALLTVLRPVLQRPFGALLFFLCSALIVVVILLLRYGLLER